MPVCLPQPEWNLDPHPGVRRAGVLAGAETVVAGTIHVVADRRRTCATLQAHQAQLLLAAGNPETEAAPVWRKVS